MKRRDDEIIDLIYPDQCAARQYQQQLSVEREKFLRWYRAEPYGNEREGWARTVHPTIFTAIEWIKPGLYEIFTGDFFGFKPMERDWAGLDEKQAAEAGAGRLKKYVRDKLFGQQDGGQIVEDFIHDALTNHYGIMKVYHKEEYDLVEEELPDTPLEAVAALEARPDVVRVSGGEVVVVPDPLTFQPVELLAGARLTRKRSTYYGFCLECVPAHELYFLPGYKSLADCPFVAHVVPRDLDYVRRRELSGAYRKGAYEAAKNEIAQRPEDSAVSAELNTWMLVDGVSERDFETWTDPHKLAANEVLIWECYTKLDLDGSGLLTPCIVTVCGGSVLSGPVANPYGGPPFELGYVFKEPHKLLGRPVASILDHRQRVLTNLLRSAQDAAALSTYSGFLTSDMQTKKRLENWGPGSVAWVSNLNQVQEVAPSDPSDFIMNALQLTLDEVGKEIGINDAQMGLDSNSLNVTAAGMSMRLTAGMQRQKLFAHRMSRAFRRILRRVLDCIRLFPPLDAPALAGGAVGLACADLDGEYSIAIDVGVGPQDKLANAQALDELIAFATQAGLQSGIMDARQLAACIKAKYDYIDVDVDEFVADGPELAARQQMRQQVQSLTSQLQQAQGQAQGLQKALAEHLRELPQRLSPVDPVAAAKLRIDAQKAKDDTDLGLRKLALDKYRVDRELEAQLALRGAGRTPGPGSAPGATGATGGPAGLAGSAGPGQEGAA
jgi:hypothetical protein